MQPYEITGGLQLVCQIACYLYFNVFFSTWKFAKKDIKICSYLGCDFNKKRRRSSWGYGLQKSLINLLGAPCGTVICYPVSSVKLCGLCSSKGVDSETHRFWLFLCKWQKPTPCFPAKEIIFTHFCWLGSLPEEKKRR